MTVVAYDPTETMRSARARYFDANAFGADGGYGDKWVDFSLGPVPFPIPNTAGRVRAVRYHDLHHILTGYDTSFVGELEISGWELGAGCGSFAAAWVINLSGLAGGCVVAPRRVFRAFVRGRRSASLYGLPLDALLDETVAEARARAHVPAVETAPTAGDVAGFAAALVAGSLAGLAMLAVTVPLLPLGLVSTALARRDKARSEVTRAAATA